MPDLISREIQLVSRPQGMPTAANFALVETKLELLQDEWVLVRNLYLSVDPYMRGRMSDRKSYVPPFELGKAMDGGAVGEVIESHAEKFKPGDLVTSNFGWREYFMAAPQQLHPVSREMEPSIYLGALGITGLTAWAGLNLVDVKAGDIIFISGAAGAVGTVAGQLAKLRGCEVIGSAGSPEKHAFYIRSPQVRALILVQAVGEHAVGLDRHLMAMGTPATSMELPTDAVTDEFIDPGDSLRVGAANGIHFLSSAENNNKLPHYPGFKFNLSTIT